MIEVKDGVRYGTGSPPEILEPSENTVPFIRATDIKEGEIKKSNLLHIAKEQPVTLQKCLLFEGEIILVRSGVNTGDCAVVTSEFTGAYAAYDLIIRLKPEIIPQFATNFLDTGIGRVQMNLLRGRAAQPHINAEEFGSIEIPLPPLEVQRVLLNKVEVAREERRRKLAEANEIIHSLDTWLLSQLNLEAAPVDNRKVFAVRLGDLQGRVDPQFHLPRFKKILQTISQTRYFPLGSLTTFSREVWNIKEDLKQGQRVFRYIEISSVNRETGEAKAEETLIAEAPSRARMFVRQGDIIVSLTRPHHGSIAQIDESLDSSVASTGFAVLRNFDLQRVNPDYLWAVLRTQSCLQQMLQRSSGGNYPAITEDELSKVLVPLPSLETQGAIAEEVRRRRFEASRLRQEAETDWQAAKRRFEEQLLTGEAA